MDPVVLQTGPEDFDVLLGDGRRRRVVLAHQARRGLASTTVPAAHVVGEVVRFLLERDGLPEGEPCRLAAAAGRYPGFVEEIRSRLG